MTDPQFALELDTAEQRFAAQTDLTAAVNQSCPQVPPLTNKLQSYFF